MTAVVTGPSALWYLTRGTGTVALVLLTLSVVLGVANVRRAHTERLPRFVFDAVHRNASLLAVVFVVVHVATSLLDGFAPIRMVDVVAPFGSAYRPLWLGFGAVAFDLLIAVALTSVVRRRLGYRVWRTVHWLAYAGWPVALLHGLGTGSDTKTTWMLTLTGACVVAVLVAIVARASAGWPDHLAVRVSAMTASAIVPVGLLVWLPTGPLAAGWARRAGTPPALLAASPNATATPPGSAVSRIGSGTPAGSSRSFDARVSGTLHEGESDEGAAIIDLSLDLTGQRLSRLRIRIAGQPLAGGGVEMTSSRVTLGPGSNPDQYRGKVTALRGTYVEARVRDANGAAITLVAHLQIDPGRGTVGGTATGRPGGGA